MKKIILVIPHYVFSSDLLQTEFIKNLADNHEVVVLSPIFLNNPPTNYYQSPKIKYLYWDTEHNKFWTFFTRVLRISLIREFDNLEYYKLRKLTKANLNWQRKILKKIGWLIPGKLVTTRAFTKIEGLLLPGSEKLKKIIEIHKPDLLLTCTPGFSPVESEAIIVSRKNGIKTAAINSSWDNFTSNAVQFRHTDYLICWNEVMKSEAIKIHGYAEDRVFISGIYRFDHHFSHIAKNVSREEFLRQKGLNPKLKTIFLSTVPPNTYPPQYKVWRETLKISRNNQLVEPVNMFIRLHPNDLIERYQEFDGLPNVHIEWPGKLKPITSSGSHKIEMDSEDLDNLRNSLKHTDININFRSSLSLEATIYNKPIINIALEGYANRYNVDWYIPILKSGGVRLVKTAEELKQTINNYLKNPELDSLGRKKIFEDYIGFTDGLSYKRSVEIINQLLGN